jgi:hypothetical protein
MARVYKENGLIINKKHGIKYALNPSKSIKNALGQGWYLYQALESVIYF